MRRFAINLNQHLTKLGLTPHSLAVEIGVSPSNFYALLAGRRPPSEALIYKLANVPQLGLSYEVLKGWDLEDELGVNPLSSSDVLGGGTLPSSLVPVTGIVSAGKLTLHVMEHLGFAPALPGSVWMDRVVAFRVKGDSMSPMIPDGSILYVRELQGPMQEGREYVVETRQGEMALKLVYFQDSEVWLIPVNLRHQPEELHVEEIVRAWEVLGWIREAALSLSPATE